MSSRDDVQPFWKSVLTFAKEGNRWERTHRIGCCRLDDDGFVVIEVHGGYEYEIDVNNLKSAGQWLCWIRQIQQKTWGRKVMSDFLAVLFKIIPGELIHD